MFLTSYKTQNQNLQDLNQEISEQNVSTSESNRNEDHRDNIYRQQYQRIDRKLNNGSRYYQKNMNTGIKQVRLLEIPTVRSGKLTRLRLWGENRSIGKLQQSWCDDIKWGSSLNQYQLAQNRETLKEKVETYSEDRERKETKENIIYSISVNFT